jgi:2-polyprenyl-6-hydroxyphenyl methylase/3-demethylubiquinone-9 3-methyltransferase
MSIHTDDSNWTVEQGSVLDVNYLKSLGQFDIVYSWGVLHHTVQCASFRKCHIACCRWGAIIIAIYNDQGRKSKLWCKVKQVIVQDCRQEFNFCFVYSLFVFRGLAVDIVKRHNPLVRYTELKKSRGMSYIS